MKKLFRRLEEILLFWGEVVYEHRKNKKQQFWY
jgi:hypothetical protein